MESTQSNDPTAKSPSTSPISATTIEIKSSFDWNITCSLQSDEELLIDAKIVEQSLFETINLQLEQSQTLDYVLVIEICQHVIAPHNGTAKVAPRRQLQTADLSNVLFVMEATERCDSCAGVTDVADRLFLDVNGALESEINSGNLTTAIQSKSQGTIDAFVQPDSAISTFTIKTSTPTNSPLTPSPTSNPNSQSKTSKQPSKNSSVSPTVSNSGKSSKVPSKGSAKSGKKTKKVKKLDSVKKKRVPLSASEAFVLQNTSIVEVTSVEILDSGHNLSSTKPSTAAYETHDSKAEGTHRGKYRAPTPSSEQNEALLSTTQ
jgi:hypothetical protein